MFRSKSLIILVALLFLSFLASCASIVSGQHQSVTFNSEPDGAKVTVSGRALGTTPLTVVLDRKSGDQAITFEKDGYKPITIPLTSNVNPWFLGNIALGGFWDQQPMG